MTRQKRLRQTLERLYNEVRDVPNPMGHTKAISPLRLVAKTRNRFPYTESQPALDRMVAHSYID